jgi:hypothetical protein
MNILLGAKQQVYRSIQNYQKKKKYSYAKLTNQGLNEGIVVVHSAIEQMQATIFRPVAHSH